MVNNKYSYFFNTSFRIDEIQYAYQIEMSLKIFDELLKKYPDLEWNTKSRKNLQDKFGEETVQNELAKITKRDDYAKVARERTAPLEQLQIIDRKKKKILSAGEKFLALLESEKEALYKHKLLNINNIELFFLSALIDYRKSKTDTSILIDYLNILKKFDFYLDKYKFYILPLYANYSHKEFCKILAGTSSNLDIYNTIKKLILKEEPSDNLANAKGTGKVEIRKKFFDYCLLVAKGTDTLENFKALLKDKKICAFYTNTIKKILGLNERKPEIIYKKINNFIIGENINCIEDFVFFDKFLKTYRNLKDYQDLNTRVLKLTNCFNFDYQAIRVNDSFKIILSHPNSNFFRDNFSDVKDFSVSFSDKILNDTYIKTEVGDLDKFSLKENKRKKEIIKKLIEEKFTKDILCNDILPLFKDHLKNKEKIQKLVNESQVATIFEYIVGVAWFYIDDENYDIFLQGMNCALSDRFLPISHATGGKTDLSLEYSDHILHIEPTLTRGDTQRHNEFEPIQRHLKRRLIKEKDKNKVKDSYGIFVAPHLHSTMLTGLSNLKGTPQYDNDIMLDFDLSILPIDTELLIELLKKKNKSYKKDIHETFKSIFEKLGDRRYEKDGVKWFDEIIVKYINNL